MEELLAALNLSYSDEDIDIDLRNQALDFLTQFTENPSNLLLLLNEFSSLPPNGQFYAINFIKVVLQRSLRHQLSLDESIVSSIQTFLFETTISFFTEENIFREDISLLSYSQVLYFFFSFPTQWSDFWSFFFSFEETSPFFVISFLISFTSLFDPSNKTAQYVNPEIGSKITSTLLTILEQMLSGGEINSLFFKIFDSYTNVIPWRCIISDDVLIPPFLIEFCISNINSEDIKLKQSIFHFLSVLSSTPFSPDFKSQILNHILTACHLNELVETIDDENILYSISNFTESCGLFFSSSEELCTFFLQPSLTFLAHPNKDISLSVLSFIRFYLTMHQESVFVIRNILLFRMKLYYEQSEFSYSDPIIDDSIEQYKDLMNLCFSIDPEGTSLMLSGISESIDAIEELPYVTTILQILICTNILDESFISNFSVLFEIDNEHILSYYEFLSINSIIQYLSLYPELDSTFCSSVFSFICSHLFTTYSNYLELLEESEENYESNLRYHLFIIEELSHSLLSFFKSFSFIPITDETISHFIEMNNQNLSSICGLFLSNSPASISEIISFYTQQLTTCFNEEEEITDSEELENYFLCAMSFSKHIHDDFIIDFYSFILSQNFATKERMKSILIESLYCSLKEKSFDFISTLIKDKLDIYSFEKLCSIICNFCIEKENNSFVFDYISQLIQHVNLYFQTFSNDQTQICNSIESFIFLLNTTKEAIFEQEIYIPQIIDILKILFTQTNTFSILPTVFDFISSVALTHKEFLLQIPIFHLFFTINHNEMNENDRIFSSTVVISVIQSLFSFLTHIREIDIHFLHVYIDSELICQVINEQLNQELHSLIESETFHICDFIKFAFELCSSLKSIS